MCHFKVIKYSGCGCERKFVISCCSQGDGTGNCSGASAYERAVQGGVCGRSNCSYYEHQRPNGRWSFEGSGSTQYPTHSNILDIHPRGPEPSPRPIPDIPVPNMPKPNIYDTRDCYTSLLFNPYSVRENYNIRPAFE